MSHLPAGWADTTIGDACEIVSGSTPSTKVHHYWGGDIAWLTPDDMSRLTTKTVAAGTRRITRQGYDSCSTTLVPPGTVLYTSRAPIGYVAIAAGPVCTNQGFKSLIPSPALSSDFLYWQLRHTTPRIRKLASGTTFPELSKRVAGTVPLLVAPLNEQRRIVSAIEEQFSRLDAADAYLAADLARLVRLRQQVIDSTGTGRLERRRLGELLDEPLANGRSVPTEPGGFRVLKLSALRDGSVETRESKEGAWSADEASPFLIRKGDFLVARGNGSRHLVGRGGLVEGEPPPVAFPDTIIRVRVSEDRIRRRFLRLVWDSTSVREQLESQARTTAGIYKINHAMLRALRIVVPGIVEQDVVTVEVEHQLSLIDAVRREIERAQRRCAVLRRAVLDRAFRGELVPQDPSDEPASVLLARIRAERETSPPARRRSAPSSR